MDLSVKYAWRKGNFKNVFKINYILLLYTTKLLNVFYQTRNSVRDGLRLR